MESVRNEFTVIIEQDEQWLVAYCPEIPGANGQGKTKEEAISSLKESVLLILEDRRQDAMKGIPGDATCETFLLAA